MQNLVVKSKKKIIDTDEPLSVVSILLLNYETTRDENVISGVHIVLVRPYSL